MIEHIAPAPSVTFAAPNEQFSTAYTMESVTTGVNLDTADLIPSRAITPVESSAPQVVGSFLLWTSLPHPSKSVCNAGEQVKHVRVPQIQEQSAEVVDQVLEDVANEVQTSRRRL